MTAGPEEPNAFVEVSEPWFDPIVAATMVELVDGLVAEPRAGVGRLPDPARPSSGRGRAPARARRDARRRRRSRRAQGRGRRGEPRRPRDPAWTSATASTSPPDGVTVLPRTTALGVYDDGYVVAHERSSDARASLARSRRSRRARDRRARALHRVRRERPTRRDARLRGGDLRGAVRRAPRGSSARSSPRTTRGLRSADSTPDRRQPTSCRPSALGEDVSAALDEADLAAGLRRLEPEPHAVAIDRRRPPLRRAAGVLPPERRGAALARGGRVGGRRRASPDRGLLARTAPGTTRRTSSTCSATRPSPTSRTRCRPGSCRSST